MQNMCIVMQCGWGKLDATAGGRARAGEARCWLDAHLTTCKDSAKIYNWWEGAGRTAVLPRLPLYISSLQQTYAYILIHNYNTHLISTISTKYRNIGNAFRLYFDSRCPAADATRRAMSGIRRPRHREPDTDYLLLHYIQYLYIGFELAARAASHTGSPVSVRRTWLTTVGTEHYVKDKYDTGRSCCILLLVKHQVIKRKLQ